MVSPNQKTAFLQDRTDMMEFNYFIWTWMNEWMNECCFNTAVNNYVKTNTSKEAHEYVTNIEMNVDMLLIISLSGMTGAGMKLTSFN